MYIFWNIVSLLSFFSFNSIQVSAHPTTNSSSVSVSTIWSWPSGSWAENIAVRRNGQILVTRLDVPELWQVDPRGRNATLVHSFDGFLGLLGITEVTRDVFAVVTSNTPPSDLTANPGTASIWTVNLRNYPRRSPVVTEVTTITESVLLNGLTTLSAAGGTILVSDSVVGVVFRVNIHNGTYTTVLDDESMKPPPGQLVGVNGIHIRGRYLYYVNSFKYSFSRVEIAEDGTAAGPFELLYTDDTAPALDDFAFNRAGVAYIAHPVATGLTRIEPDGSGEVILANVNATLGSTADAFSRDGRQTLYVVTNGGYLLDVFDGAKVLAITGL